jgi:hypothetical protein
VKKVLLSVCEQVIFGDGGKRRKSSWFCPTVLMSVREQEICSDDGKRKRYWRCSRSDVDRRTQQKTQQQQQKRKITKAETEQQPRKKNQKNKEYARTMLTVKERGKLAKMHCASTPESLGRQR